MAPTNTDMQPGKGTGTKFDIELYRIYLDTAERVSDRRAAANSWMLSVNSALVGLYGYLHLGSEVVDAQAKEVWLWAIPIAGALVCISWSAILTSYRQLNNVKLKVLGEFEQSLPFPPFRREYEHYRASKRISLSKIERWVPWTFILLYLSIVTAVLSP